MIGRVQANISVGDVSISRRHGVIGCSGGGEAGRSPPEVHVRDLGSTYGTYVGEEAIRSSGESSQADRLPKGESAPLADKTRVRFGLHSTIFK